MCEHCRPGEPLPSISEINAERERIARAERVAEIFAVDHTHDANGYEHSESVGERQDWKTPGAGSEAIEYVKRVRRSIQSLEWDWNEETKQSARSIFSTIIEALQLETACANCDESLADCSCTECGGCSKRFDAGDICRNCSKCESCCTCSYCEGCENKRNEDSMCSSCEHCADCCECVACGSCGRRGDPDNFYTCGDCGRCERCCNCTSCGHCGEHCDATCSECDRCEFCCRCEDGFNGGSDSDNTPRVSFDEKFRKPTRLQLKRSALKRFVGMELELSKVKNGDPLKKWARERNAGLVEDASLVERGVEIVTSPSAGDIFLDDCSTLAETLKSVGAEVDDTCGLHVHADARDYHAADLRRLIILYSAVERAMFELVSRTRMGNTYCQACGFKYLKMLENDTSKAHKDFRKALHLTLYDNDGEYQRHPSITPKILGEHIKRGKSEKYHKSRYYALNLHTFFFRKTVEFRLHESHLNPEVYTNWSLFCGWIVEKAYSLSERQMLELFQRHATDNGESLLREILPGDVSEWLLTRLETRRKARLEGQSVESTDMRLTEYTRPGDALSADIWHTSNVSTAFLFRRIKNLDQTEMF